MRISRFQSAGVCVVFAALCGCGGGGAASPAHIVPAISGTPSALAGPVSYMASSGPLTATGNIVQGTTQAIVAVMSGSAAAGQTFAQDTLGVSVPGATSSAATRRPQPQSVAREIHPESFPADASQLLQALRADVRGSDANARAPEPKTASAPVGSTMNVWVQPGGYQSHTYASVPAVLVAQSAHGNIWVQTTVAASVQPYAQQIANDFENAYASDTQHFASPDYPSNAPGMQPQYSSCSSGGSAQGTGPAYIAEPADKRVDVMIVDSSTMGGWGGYFSAANLMTQGALNCLKNGWESNQAPFIYVTWYDNAGATYDVQEDLVRSCAHEFQHLINFVNHAILAPGASSSSFNGSEAQYVNEGLSMLAQDLAVDRMYGAQGVHFDAADALQRVNAYLANPAAFSISGFDGIDTSQWGGDGIDAHYNCSGGCYGGAYLFARYLHDRFGGDTFTHAIETGGVTGTANLRQSTGEEAADLFGDFALAMAAGTLRISTGNPRFDFGTLDLTATYPDQFGSSVTLIGINATPMNGSTVTVHAPVGGFAYVSVTGAPPGGANVQVTDDAAAPGFSLLGGLAQH